MPRAIDGTVSVPNTFTPHTVASSAQVNANHADHAQVAETFWGNLLIGGDFSLNPWQRGTTFTGIATGAYSADRWRVDYVTTAVVDVLKTADAPTIAQAGAFAQHCLHIDVTTADALIAATDVFTVGQRIEGLNAAYLGWGQTGARSATLSFWVKSPKTGIHCVAFRNSATDRSYIAEYTVSVADTWERKTVTVPGDTTGTWLYTTGIGINITWALVAGANFQATAGAWASSAAIATANQVNCLDNVANNFKLALVQFEMGSQARPFGAKPFYDVLAACRRYYQKSFALATAPAQNLGTFTGEHIWDYPGGGSDMDRVQFGTPMRVAPTITLYNPAATNGELRNETDNADWSASGTGHITELGFTPFGTPNGTAGAGDRIGVHWAASAEL